MSRKLIYLGKGNTLDYQPRANGAAVDLSGVTRMTAEIDGKILDSAVLGGNINGNAFYWTSGVPAPNEANLFLRLGVAVASAGITAGWYFMQITVYDSTHVNGLVWLDSERVEVK